jgi:ferric-dicitrate binding protein FerR (iron transport regulator)
MRHQHYKAADLARNASFQKWVLEQDQDAHAYWTKWLHDHPEKQQEVREAIEMIETLEFSNDVDTNEAFVSVWQQVHDKTIGKPRKQYRHLAAAACVALLLVSGLVAFWWNSSSDKYLTFSSDHTTSTFVLPDSSTIMLNAGSKVKYLLNKENNRELWLEGEAFFEVKRWISEATSKPSSFTVHTPNASIEVLGTAFSLYEDKSKTMVVLTHGKVKVIASQSQPVFLEPGEFAEVKADVPSIKKKKVDTKLYTSWTTNSIRFEQTPLVEIAAWIEDRYRKKVVIPDSMDSITFTASLPKVELKLLLEALKVAYQLEVEEEEDVIVFKEK